MTDKRIFLITKHAGAVRVFALDAAALTRFETADADQLAREVQTHIVEKANELNADFITTKDLLAIYNTAADRCERPKLSKFQDKPSAIERTFPALGEAADLYPEAFLSLFPTTAPAGDAPSAPEPAAEKPKRAPKPKDTSDSKAVTFKARPPKSKVHPCRAGTKQAALVDALAKGATMEQLRKAVGGAWSDSSIKSALYWDINSQKGYGVTAEPNGKGELVFSLTYPKDQDGPLAHTPSKANRA